MKLNSRTLEQAVKQGAKITKAMTSEKGFVNGLNWEIPLTTKSFETPNGLHLFQEVYKPKDVYSSLRLKFLKSRLRDDESTRGLDDAFDTSRGSSIRYILESTKERTGQDGISIMGVIKQPEPDQSGIIIGTFPKEKSQYHADYIVKKAKRLLPSGTANEFANALAKPNRNSSYLYFSEYQPERVLGFFSNKYKANFINAGNWHLTPRKALITDAHEGSMHPTDDLILNKTPYWKDYQDFVTSLHLDRLPKPAAEGSKHWYEARATTQGDGTLAWANTAKTADELDESIHSLVESLNDPNIPLSKKEQLFNIFYNDADNAYGEDYKNAMQYLSEPEKEKVIKHWAKILTLPTVAATLSYPIINNYEETNRNTL